MPAPATADEFVDLVTRSGVADGARVKSFLQKLAGEGGVPADPSKLAGVFVRDGLLTYFQADQLLQGKWKRFFIGKYKVLERLGSGGMGQVFLCEHKLMRRRVAVKVLPAAKAAESATTPSTTLGGSAAIGRAASPWTGASAGVCAVKPS